MSTRQLGPLEVDSSGVAGVSCRLRVKVEVEGSGAGDDVVLASRHTEGVEDVPTEPPHRVRTVISVYFSPGEGLLRVPAIHVGVRDQYEVVPVRLAGVGRVAVTAAAHTVEVPAVRGLGGVQPAVSRGQVRSHWGETYLRQQCPTSLLIQTV